MLRLLRILPLALFLAAPLRAQDPAPVDTVPAPVVDTLVAVDTAGVRVPVEQVRPAPPVVQTDTVEAEGGISPGGAFARSLVLPGWGQSVLGAPERGGLYFALEAGSLWMVWRSARKLDEAERFQDELRRTGQLAPTDRTALVRARSQQREDWITLSVFWLFFSGADAFVTAHLQDFDERIEIGATPDGQALQVGASVPTELIFGRR